MRLEKIYIQDFTNDGVSYSNITLKVPKFVDIFNVGQSALLSYTTTATVEGEVVVTKVEDVQVAIAYTNMSSEGIIIQLSDSFELAVFDIFRKCINFDTAHTFTGTIYIVNYGEAGGEKFIYVENKTLAQAVTDDLVAGDYLKLYLGGELAYAYYHVGI